MISRSHTGHDHSRRLQQGSSRPSESQAVSPAVVEFLLTSAATDFHTQRPAGPVRFREVRVGHVMTPSGEDQYRLCGEFLPGRGSRQG